MFVLDEALLTVDLSVKRMDMSGKHALTKGRHHLPGGIVELSGKDHVDDAGFHTEPEIQCLMRLRETAVVPGAFQNRAEDDLIEATPVEDRRRNV